MSSEVPPGAARADRPFSPSAPPQCSKHDCEATAVVRVDALDACGRHTNWAITRQVGEMQRREIPVGRYRRMT
jgi:hypothetical protein